MNKEDLNDILFNNTNTSQSINNYPPKVNSKILTPNMPNSKLRVSKSMDKQQQQQAQQHQHQLSSTTPHHHHHHNHRRNEFDEINQIVNSIPFPGDDLSLTSFTNSSHSNSTPYKHHHHRDHHNDQSSDEKDLDNHHNQQQQQQHNPAIRTQQLKGQNPPYGANTSNIAGIGANNGNNTIGGGGIGNNSATEKRTKSINNPKQSIGQNVQKALYLNFEKEIIAEEAQGSSIESMTPSRMNTILDWNKNHVTPGDSKSIFPQVLAPSLDMSHGELNQTNSQLNQNLPRSNTIENTNNNNSNTVNYSEDIPTYDKNTNDQQIYKNIEDSKLRIMKSKAEEENTQLKHELTFQKKLYNKLSQENTYLNHRIAELEEHLELLKAQEKGNLKALRQNMLEQAKTKIYELSGKLDQKDDKIYELQDILQKTVNNEEVYKQSVNKELENLNIEIDRYRILCKTHQDKVKELEKTIKGLNEKHNQELKNMKALIDNLSQNIQNFQGERNELNQEIDKLMSENKKLHDTVTELSDLVTQASEKLEEKEKQIEFLKKQNDLYMIDQNKILGLNLDVDKHWENKYEELKEENERIRKTYEKQILKLKNDLNQYKMNTQQQQSTSLMDISQNIQENLGYIFEEKDKTIQEIKSENQKLKDYYEKELVGHKQHIHELNEKIMYYEQRIKDQLEDYPGNNIGNMSWNAGNVMNTSGNSTVGAGAGAGSGSGSGGIMGGNTNNSVNTLPSGLELPKAFPNSISALEQTKTQGIEYLGMNKGMVNQGISCNLYLNGLEDILVNLNLKDWNVLSYEENLMKINENIQIMQHEIEDYERNIVELKKMHIVNNTEMKLLKKEYDNLKLKYAEMELLNRESQNVMQALKQENMELNKKLLTAQNNSSIHGNNNNNNNNNGQAMISAGQHKENNSNISGNDNNGHSMLENNDNGNGINDINEYNLMQLTQDYKSLEADYKDLYDKLRSSEINSKTLEIDLKKANSQLQRSKEEIELLRLELENNRQYDNEHDVHIIDIRKTLNERIRILEDRINKLLDEINIKDMELHEIRIEKDNLNQEKGKLEKKLEQKDMDMQTILTKIKELEIALANEQKSKEAYISQYENTMKVNKEKIIQIEQENMSLIKELTGTKQVLSDKELTLKRLENDKNILTLDVEKLTNRLKINNEDNEKFLKEQYNTLLNNLKDKDNTIQILNTQLKNIELLKEELIKNHEEILLSKQRNYDIEKRNYEERLNILQEERKILYNKNNEEIEYINNKTSESLNKLIKEKQVEIKTLLDTIYKNEDIISKLNKDIVAKEKDIGNKEKEIEKLKSQQEQQNSKNSEEKKSLKQKLDEYELLNTKLKEENKNKTEQLKVLEEKHEKNANYLKEKDKKNIELYNNNKSLLENIKNYEELNTNLKNELDKKNKLLATKANELKTLTSTLKKIEDKNHELNSNNLELNITIQKLQNEISTLNLKILSGISSNNNGIDSTNGDNGRDIGMDNGNNQHENHHHHNCKTKTNNDNILIVPEGKRIDYCLSCSSSCTRNLDKAENEINNNNNNLLMENLKKLYNEFTIKESQFEELKGNFVNKINKLNAQIQLLENKCNSLQDENDFIKEQNKLKQNSNDILNQKIKNLETIIKTMNSTSNTKTQNTVDYNLNDLNRHTATTTNMSYINTTSSIANHHSHPQQQTELKTKRYGYTNTNNTNGFEPMNISTHSDIVEANNKSRGHGMITRQMSQNTMERELSLDTGYKTATENIAPENVFMNNIMDMISPEMLSAEDTVSLMVEFIRRASQSVKLTTMLANNQEFCMFSQLIKSEKDRTMGNSNFINVDNSLPPTEIRKRKTQRSVITESYDHSNNNNNYSYSQRGRNTISTNYSTN